jgi:hypothetical protein
VVQPSTMNLAPEPEPEVSHDPSPRNVPLPPPPAAAAPLPPPAVMPPPATTPAPASATPKVTGDERYKSGLLVVLDDDQEMPTSEKFERRSARSSSVVKVESFDEEDSGDKKKSGTQVDLPDLPKL